MVNHAQRQSKTLRESDSEGFSISQTLLRHDPIPIRTNKRIVILTHQLEDVGPFERFDAKLYWKRCSGRKAGPRTQHSKTREMSVYSPPSLPSAEISLGSDLRVNGLPAARARFLASF